MSDLPRVVPSDIGGQQHGCSCGRCTTHLRNLLAGAHAAGFAEGTTAAANLCDELDATYEAEDHTPDLPFTRKGAGDAIRLLRGKP